MAFLPINSLFIYVLVSAVIFSLSSAHMFGVWLGIELNMLSFVVLMGLEKFIGSMESSIKYFLLQAMGSGVFFLGCVFNYLENYCWMLSINPSVSGVLILLGFTVKLGMAPMHFWVPSVMAGLGWLNLFILSTIQKIIPLVFFSLFYFSSSSLTIIIFMAAISAVVGGLGGLNQTQMRPLLGYSSINHLGWLASLSLMSFTYLMFYFSIYSLMLLGIIFMLSLNNQNSFVLFFNNYNFFGLLLIIFLLSLGGLPPLLGFFPKMMAFQILFSKELIGLLLVLILGSLISLFYYLSISFLVLLGGASSLINNLNFKLFSSGLYLLMISFFIMLLFSGVLLMMLFNSLV